MPATVFAHFRLVYGGSDHFASHEMLAAELEELEDAAASVLGRFAGAAPAVESRRGATIGVASAELKLFFSASFVGLYATLARAELSALWAVTQLSCWSSLQGQFRIAHGYLSAGTTWQ